MRVLPQRYKFAPLAIIGSLLLCSGCSFLPGFGLLEQPALYAVDVNNVANQVACEIQEFATQQQAIEQALEGIPKKAKNAVDQPYNSDGRHRWVLADEDVKVKLNLQTDESGYVNFTGVNAAQLGLQTLASLITTQSKVSTLGAKLTAKRTKTVEVDFTVSAKPLANSDKTTNSDGKLVNFNCHPYFLDQAPISKLYLRDWLTNYFATINFDASKPDRVKLLSTDPNAPTESERLQDDFLNKTRNLASPQAIPQQFKIQSVELSTSLLIAADISGGATPNVLGNGSVFVLPINGLSLDYNPDYSHKIDITMSMCDNSGQDECNAKQAPSVLTPQLNDQCHLYARLAPILTGMSPPKDVQTQADIDNHKKEPNPYHCSKTGLYPGTYVDKNGVPYPDLPVGPPILPIKPPSASKR